MSLKSFNSIDRLIKHGNSLLTDIDVISFDIFDTLLVRRIHDPDLVKTAVARQLSRLAAIRGKQISVANILSTRNHHEEQSRQQCLKRSGDSEARYPEFMRRAIAELFASDERQHESIYGQIREYELNLENALLVPRQALVEWLQGLCHQGKRILLISDIYLTYDELSLFINSIGLSEYTDRLISSADISMSKASGQAYSHIQGQFDIDPARWLHIGDNLHSDGYRASQAGIHALLISDSEEQRRISISHHYYRIAQKSTFWKGRALQQFMAPLEGENRPQSEQYIAGYNFFAPLIGLFTQAIMEYCQQNNITKLYFCAREGWLFKQAWESIAPWLSPEEQRPQIEYLYVSRKALAAASCGQTGLSLENAEAILVSPRVITICDLLKAFGLNESGLQSILKSHQLSAQSILNQQHADFDPQNRMHFEQLLEDERFQQQVRQQTQPQNRALVTYLEQCGYFEQQDIALIDIGWLGTIQRYFCSAIEHRKDRPRCHGLLFGATARTRMNNDHNHLQGLIFDINEDNAAASAILYAQDIFEEACRAPHPSLDSYQLDAERGYELGFKAETGSERQQELTQSQHYSDLQSAILEGCRRYGPAAAVMGGDSSDFRPWVSYLLMSMLAFPKNREINALAYKHHLDDFLGDLTQKNKAPSPSFLGNPWRLEGWRQLANKPFRAYLFMRHLQHQRASTHA